MYHTDPFLEQVRYTQAFNAAAVDYVDGLLKPHHPDDYARHFSTQTRCQMIGVLGAFLLNENKIQKLKPKLHAAAIPANASAQNADPAPASAHATALFHLFNLQACSGFSPVLRDTLNSKIPALIQSICNRPHILSPLNAWDKLSKTERFNVLGNIKTLHENVYGLSPTAALSIIKLRQHKRRLGMASVPLGGPAKAFLNRSLLALPETHMPLHVLHHEMTHIFVGQLANDWHKGAIAPDNPLAADAALAFYRKIYHAYCPPETGEPYATDPEEIIVDQNAKKFTAHCNRTPAFESCRLAPHSV